MKAGDIDVIKMMLVKARKKVATAKTNLDNDQYDDAVSRTYYAVFHAISAALLSKGLHFSSHGQTIGAFNREFIKTKKFPPLLAKQLKNCSESDKWVIMMSKAILTLILQKRIWRKQKKL